MKVLIVDDSPVGRQHLNYIVTKAGYDTLLFESAPALLEWMESNSLAETLIMIDWVMPKVQGPELCRMIREKHATANTYLIIASAKSESLDIAEGLNSGADDYLSKPLDGQEVIARLEVGIRTLRLRSALDEANRRRLAAERYAGVGQLAAGAAHEINNPLGFLKSNLALLQAELASVLGEIQPTAEAPQTSSDGNQERNRERFEDLEDMLVDMCLGVDRIGAIVDSLRAFTQKLPTEKSPVNLSELLRGKLDPAVNIDIDVEPPVYADAYQLLQLINELVANALWATRDKGAVKLCATVVGQNLQIRVQDSGCGIPEADLERVMDPFFTTHKVGDGLGMGLSRVQAIVNNHAGELRLSSQLGVGTEVICEMPLK